MFKCYTRSVFDLYLASAYGGDNSGLPPDGLEFVSYGGVTDSIGKSSGPVQPGRGYTGNGTAYITIVGLLATDTIAAASTGQPICTINGRLDIANGVSVWGITISRSGQQIGYYKCAEGIGTVCINAFSGDGALPSGVISDGTIHTEFIDGTGFDLNIEGFSFADKEPPLYTDYLNPVYPGYTPTGSTYYVRADGTATTIAAATSDLSASTSINPTNFNSHSGELLPGDLVIVSGRGGTVTYLYLYAAGTEENPITIRNSSDAPATLSHPVHICNAYIDVIDLEVDVGGLLSDCLQIDLGNKVDDQIGVRTFNLRLLNSSNQAIQHEGNVEVIHYNLYCEGCADEGVSSHSDLPTVTCIGGAIVNCRSGVNWVGDPTITLRNMFISCAGQDGEPVEPPPEEGSGTITVDNCVLVYGTNQRSDFILGDFTITNNEFYGIGPSWLLVFYATISSLTLNSNLFVDGDATRTKAVIYNAFAGDYQNNTFLNHDTGRMFDGATGNRSGSVEYKKGAIYLLGATGLIPQYEGRLKYSPEIVSGDNWDNYVLKWPVCPELITLDDGRLFTAGVANEVAAATYKTWLGDQFFASDYREQIAIYKSDQVEPTLSKIKSWAKIT